MRENINMRIHYNKRMKKAERIVFVQFPYFLFILKINKLNRTSMRMETITFS